MIITGNNNIMFLAKFLLLYDKICLNDALTFYGEVVILTIVVVLSFTPYLLKLSATKLLFSLFSGENISITQLKYRVLINGSEKKVLSITLKYSSTN